ncbi:hypothetical protein V2154_16715 [Ewingella sp. CoE-038-23]|uniref:hypothetical protein n=1 Tax=Ewingella docleensis TaxID=3118588 RepID=UPI003365621A
MEENSRLPESVILTLLTDPSFSVCLERCMEEDELITNFCRIYEVELPKAPRHGIEAMIDEATGYRKDCFDKFLTAFIPFVYRVVYLPLKSQSAL